MRQVFFKETDGYRVRVCFEIEIFQRNAYGLEDTSSFVRYALFSEKDDFRVKLCVKIEIFFKECL